VDQDHLPDVPCRAASGERPGEVEAVGVGGDGDGRPPATARVGFTLPLVTGPVTAVTGLTDAAR
jgi:hypothetical protein